MGQPAPPTRRRALRCVGIAFLAILLTTTIASCLVVVLHFGDDGGALVAEAGRPTARQCLHSVVRLRAATLGVRPGRFAVPLRREGRGVVVVGLAGGAGRETVERAVRYAARAAGLRAAAPTCCDGRRGAWDFRNRHERQAVVHSSGWPFEAWVEPASYHPFLLAAVPSARSQVVALALGRAPRGLGAARRRALRRRGAAARARLLGAARGARDGRGPRLRRRGARPARRRRRRVLRPPRRRRGTPRDDGPRRRLGAQVRGPRPPPPVEAARGPAPRPRLARDRARRCRGRRRRLRRLPAGKWGRRSVISKLYCRLRDMLSSQARLRPAPRLCCRKLVILNVYLRIDFYFPREAPLMWL